jgi:hypothetical protein
LLYTWTSSIASMSKIQPKTTNLSSWEFVDMPVEHVAKAQVHFTFGWAKCANGLAKSLNGLASRSAGLASPFVWCHQTNGLVSGL